jgi:UDP-GlcNAc:undecaprenyl-phosphate GlcNAc-1-phosphate transferase
VVSYALLFAIALAASLGLTPLVGRLARRVGAMDRPEARKVHARSLPRFGGLAVVLAAAAAVVAARALGVPSGAGPDADRAVWLPIVVGGAIVFGTGLLDDLRPLAAPVKLGAEIAAAAAAIALGVRVERVTVLGETHDLGWAVVPFTLLWIVGLTNAFNLVDGLDGLAVGLAIIASGTCAVILIARGDVAGATALVALIGALGGFLPYNWSPARIFLGDGGSLLLGYVLAVTSITGTLKGAAALALSVPLMIFALPLVETASTAVRRLAERPATGPRPPASMDLARRLRRLVEPDRAHLHHRLVDRGLGQRSVVLVFYLLAAGLSALALASARVP